MNKGADQLCSHCTDDLCLRFPIGKTPVSHDPAQMLTKVSLFRYKLLFPHTILKPHNESCIAIYVITTKAQISLHTGVGSINTFKFAYI